MKKKTGFTLVEIMIVVAIIGLLAAIAIPSFVKARNVSRANACINNLRQIDSGKEQAAMAENWADDATLDDADQLIALSYVRGATDITWLDTTCPAGGEYTVGDMAVLPACDQTNAVPPHVLD